MKHIKKFAPTDDPTTLLGSITAPAKDHLTKARDNGLVSWPGTEPERPESRVSVCLLENRAEVDSRDESVRFWKKYRDDHRDEHREHRDEPTIETAEMWQKYGHDLATLADCLSRKETIRTGIKSSPAMRPSGEVKTEEDLRDLNKLIVDLEGRLVDVMFVVRIRPAYCWPGH